MPPPETADWLATEVPRPPGDQPVLDTGLPQVDRPAFSICLPTFNRARMLGRAIRSALAQTVDNFELIVCDNASTDDTPAVVGAIRDPRLRYVRYDRLVGMYANHNRGLDFARADWVVYLHSDDELEADCLAIIRDILAAEREPPAAVGQFKPHAVYDRLLPSLSSPVIRLPRDTGLSVHIAHSIFLPPSGTAYRTVLLRREPFDELGISGDYLLTMRWLFDDWTILLTRRPLLRKHDHPESGGARSLWTGSFHFAMARTIRMLSNHAVWPGVQTELRAQIRRYPVYHQAHMLKGLAQAGLWKDFWQLLPRVSPLALFTRQWAHILGAGLLGRFYWRLIPHLTSPGTRLRALVVRGEQS